MHTAMSRSWKILSLAVLATLFITAVWLLVERKLFGPAGGPHEISLSGLKKGPPPEPGEPPKVAWAKPHLSTTEQQTFLDRDFQIVRTVSALPAAVLKIYTVKDGGWLVMTDPGKRLQNTDDIEDLTLPTRRLIFAGVSEDRAFVFYEMEGVMHSFILDLFELKSPEVAVGLWRGYCEGSAKNLDDLRRRAARGHCY